MEELLEGKARIGRTSAGAQGIRSKAKVGEVSASIFIQFVKAAEKGIASI